MFDVPDAGKDVFYSVLLEKFTTSPLNTTICFYFEMLISEILFCLNLVKKKKLMNIY